MPKKCVLYGKQILSDEYSNAYKVFTKNNPNKLYINYSEWIPTKILLIEAHSYICRQAPYPLSNFSKYYFKDESDMLMFKLKYPLFEWNTRNHYIQEIIKGTREHIIKSEKYYNDVIEELASSFIIDENDTESASKTRWIDKIKFW